MEAVADLPEFLRRDVDALLLGIRALSLALGSKAERLQLRFHLLHCPGELSQLSRDACYVFLGARTGSDFTARRLALTS